MLVKKFVMAAKSIVQDGADDRLQQLTAEVRQCTNPYVRSLLGL